MNHVIIILRKQMKDTLKNKAVLIQFVMFPIMAFVMTKSVKIEGMPPDFFVNLFAAMYVGMAPLVAMTAIISEEKEKNTLRVLMMAEVTPGQYLAGVGGYVFGVCMAGAAFFCALSERGTVRERAVFLLIMAAGILASLILGAAIGMGSANQMAATSVTVPVMMIFSFLPMLSMFNENIKRAAQVTYSQQISVLLDTPEIGRDCVQSVIIIAGNMILFGVLFGLFYKKGGLCK